MDEEEKMMILVRDEQIKSIGIENDLNYLPNLFGQEIVDHVIASIRRYVEKCTQSLFYV